jgi:FkbM family methyltransferase
LSLLDRLRTLAYYARTFRNRLQVVAMHRSRRDVGVLYLRSGHEVHLLDPRAEIWAFRSIFRERCYDMDFGPLAADGVVVDLGANVGIFSLYAATRLVPNGKVLAVEANPDCFAKLEKTTATCANVTLWQGAVGNRTELWLSEDSLGASVFKSKGSIARLDVRPISHESILTFAPRIDLLKANMEGAEYPLLLETPSSLWDGVQRLAVKWHDGEIAGGHRPGELTARMESLGFRVLRHQAIWTDASGALTTGITTATRVQD